MQNKYKNLIKDTFIFAVGGIGSKLILFLLVPLYTNYLTTEEYGVADLIFTVSQLVIPFVSLVVFEAVIRFALSKNEKKEDVLLASLVVWLIGSLATLAMTPLVGLYAPIAKWKWYLSLYVILNVLNSIELNYIKAKEQNKLYALISIIQTLAMALANVLLIAVIPLGVDGYVIANIVGTLVAALGIFLCSNIFADLKKARFSGNLLKRMLIYSAPLVLNNVSWWVIHSVNKIIVELVLGASLLGIFTVATKIPALINVLISIFQQSWGISSIKEVENTNDSGFYSNVFKVFSFIAFGASFGIILIIKPLMTVYVGADFADSWKYVPLLLVGATFSAISSYFGSLTAALKKSVNNMVTTIISAVVNVTVCIFFINKIGLWSAVIGTLAAYFVMAFIRMIDVVRYLRFKIGFVRFALNSIILLAVATLVSLEIAIYAVAASGLCLFLIVNFDSIKELAHKLKGK